MRSHAWLCVSLVAALGCGKVKDNPDAPVTPDDGPNIDAPVDAPLDAPPGPTPKLHWEFEGNTNNSGSLNGFALATPSGISFVPGKVGMGASFGPGQFSNVAGMDAVLGTFPKVTIGFWMKEPGLTGTIILDISKRVSCPCGGIQLAANAPQYNLCVSTTSNGALGGGCLDVGNTTAPNVFHHWILRYDGTGTATGQGGKLQVFIDNVLVHTRNNDAANDPVFNNTMPDTLSVGGPNMILDDVRVYDQVFTPEEQCTFIIGGTVSGNTCMLP